MRYKLVLQTESVFPQFPIAQFSFVLGSISVCIWPWLKRIKLNISIIFPQANLSFYITPFCTILPEQMNNFSCSQAKLVLYNNAPCWLLDQWSCSRIRHPFWTDNDQVSIVFGCIGNHHSVLIYCSLELYLKDLAYVEYVLHIGIVFELSVPRCTDVVASVH